jgi:hypothetical protein
MMHKIDLLIKALCECRKTYDEYDVEKYIWSLRGLITYDDHFDPERAKKKGIDNKIIITKSGISRWGFHGGGHGRPSPTLTHVSDLETYLRTSSNAGIEHRMNVYGQDFYKEWDSKARFRSDLLKNPQFIEASKAQSKIAEEMKKKLITARDNYLLSESFIKLKNELNIDKKPTVTEAIALAESILGR